jgi:AraC-like DNA-binding protein
MRATIQNAGRFIMTPQRLILPDPCCDLSFVGERAFVTGAMTSARPSAFVGQEVLLLRIGVGAARTLLGVPLSELTDRVTLLDEVNPGLARNVARRLEADGFAAPWGRPWEATTADARFLVAARLLARGSTVRAAAGAAAISDRQLARLMHDRIGVAPKLFARLARFRRAVFAAWRGAPLAAAASLQGYADQAHFSREARALTGRSVRTLLTALPPPANVGSVQDLDRWQHVGCE